VELVEGVENTGNEENDAERVIVGNERPGDEERVDDVLRVEYVEESETCDVVEDKLNVKDVRSIERDEKVVVEVGHVGVFVEEWNVECAEDAGDEMSVEGAAGTAIAEEVGFDAKLAGIESVGFVEDAANAGDVGYVEDIVDKDIAVDGLDT